MKEGSPHFSIYATFLKIREPQTANCGCPDTFDIHKILPSPLALLRKLNSPLLPIMLIVYAMVVEKWPDRERERERERTSFIRHNQTHKLDKKAPSVARAE